MPVKPKPHTSKSPDPILPTARYHVRHLEGTQPHRRPCIHFITFGRDYGPVHIRFPTTTLHLDLSAHDPPSDLLCARYTGLHPKIHKAFFDFPANEDEFHNALVALRRKVKEVVHRGGGGGCVAFAINCRAGRHRSVAMAERLADRVGVRDGFRAECLHLDLRKGADWRDLELARVDGAAAGEMEEGVLRRGRVSVRDEGRAREEARVGEDEIRVWRVRKSSPVRGRVNVRDKGRAREEARVGEDDFRVKRVWDISPTRGRASLRDEGRAREEARVGENGPRGARGQGAPPRRESKTVSWETSVPVREPHRRRGENGDGSAGPLGKDGERRR